MVGPQSGGDKKSAAFQTYDDKGIQNQLGVYLGDKIAPLQPAYPSQESLDIRESVRLSFHYISDSDLYHFIFGYFMKE